MLTLFTGGQSCGKSALAEAALARKNGSKAIIATGRALDDSFRNRIMRHKAVRDPSIPVFEAGADLAAILQTAMNRHQAILVDGLDYWLYTCICEDSIQQRSKEFLATLANTENREIIVVSCETGLGPVAADSQTRAFTRSLGELNQRIAAIAHNVYLVAAGLAVSLKTPLE